MGKILLTRIDDRLVHGQVMTKWSKGLGINAIFIIDNGVAKDDFMKQIFISSGSKSGLAVKVLSIDEAVAYWNEKQFDNYNAILLFKTIPAVEDAINKGLPIKQMNVGGVGKKKDTKFVITSVSIDQSEANILIRLRDTYKVEIFFQTIPDSSKVTLADALKSF
jgi:PTS system mannose-specific IIB component